MNSVLKHINNNLHRRRGLIAVSQGSQSYTYQEMEESVKQFTYQLLKSGVGSGSNVVTCMNRSYDSLVAMLSVANLGAIHCPIDTSRSERDVAEIIDCLDPVCLVVDSHLILSMPKKDGLKIITLYDDISCDEGIEMGVDLPDEGAPVYMVHTSGSSGKPKGVCVSYSNVKNHLVWLSKLLDLSDKDTFSLNSSLAFDFSVACTYLPLYLGASISITKEYETLDIPEYLDSLRKNKVTVVKWTPSYFKLVLDCSEKHKKPLPDIRWVIFGGEELLTDDVRRWNKLYPNHALVNEYGPTETTVAVSAYVIKVDALLNLGPSVPIGTPANKTSFYIVDQEGRLLEGPGVGELWVGGDSVSLGYYQNESETQRKFIKNPFGGEEKILYKTGDLVERSANGNYIYVSRIDRQVKINGRRINLSGIEKVISNIESVKQVVVCEEKGDNHQSYLDAYVQADLGLDSNAIRKFCTDNLSKGQVPKNFILIPSIPLTKNGKADYEMIKSYKIKSDTIDESNLKNMPTLLKELIVMFSKYSEVDVSNLNKPFSSLGLSSVDLTSIVSNIKSNYKKNIRIQDMFKYESIRRIYEFLKEKPAKETNNDKCNNNYSDSEDIAIIGMDCQSCGVNSPDELWEICSKAKVTINKYDVTHENKSGSKTVHVRGAIENLECFDADFFGISYAEADMMDPQHRLLIQSSWTALEKAGYSPGSLREKVAVILSMNDSTYLLNHYPEFLAKGKFKDTFSIQRLTSPGFLSNKVAYHLNCTGPVINNQTACSSSLVSVILACEQLQLGNCDMAIAGGISITTPQDAPYLYRKGNIFSSDGVCRPFDQDANGTVFSNGLGVVVLKKLSSAKRDKDKILALVKGYSTNNDGSRKAGFASPSIVGQYACIKDAYDRFSIDPESIGYIESHGTGTRVGDPVEVQSLEEVFGEKTKKTSFCALGSLKGNIGHTHIASGVLGLIKTVMALRNKSIPPMANIKTPNPAIDWVNSPFYINSRLRRWVSKNGPRRGAVSSFGVGGSNAHLVLEEAPDRVDSEPCQDKQILLFSAKNIDSLICTIKAFHELFKQKSISSEEVADIAYTLKTGRGSFEYRCFVEGGNQSEVSAALENLLHRVVNEGLEKLSIFNKPTAVVVSDEVISDISLIKNLYQNNVKYKIQVDACLAEFKKYEKYQLISLSEAARFEREIGFISGYSLVRVLSDSGVKIDSIVSIKPNNDWARCLCELSSVKEAVRFFVAIRGGLGSGKAVLESIPLLHLDQDDLGSRDVLSEYSVVALGLARSFCGIQPLDLMNEALAGIKSSPDSPAVLDLIISKLWVQGSQVGWHDFYLNKRNKYCLPTYPFNKQYHWLDSSPAGTSMTSQGDIKKYEPTWKKGVDLRGLNWKQNKFEEHETWLIFDDMSPLSQGICSYLSKLGLAPALVRAGNAYAQADGVFTIDPKSKSDHRKVLERLPINSNSKIHVISLWPYLESAYDEASLLGTQNFDTWFVSPIYFFQALEGRSHCSLTLVSTQLYSITGEESLNPNKIIIEGLARVIPLEGRKTQVSVVDLGGELPMRKTGFYSKYIVDAINSNFLVESLHIRNDYTWIPVYDEMPLVEIPDKKFLFNPNGVYVITGGLGAMGLTIADWISSVSSANLVLISRREFPDKSNWDKHRERSGEIKKILEIQARGSCVDVFSCDVSSGDKMSHVFEEIYKKYFSINGLFHLAGNPGEGIAQNKLVEDMLPVFKPKIDGSIVLAKILKNKKLDFVVFASSLTAIVGGIGQVDYCSANLFLDRFLETRPFSQCDRVISINWNSWEDIGMAAEVDERKKHHQLYQGNSISSFKAIEVMIEILSGVRGSVVVSRYSPKEERKRIKDFFSIESRKSDLYKEDYGDILVSIWKKILGVDQVKVDDDFYSLGGDSLLAIDLLEEIDKKFSINLSLSQLPYLRTIKDIEKVILLNPLPSYGPIFPINKDQENKRSKKVVYLIHPIGGSSLCYLPLLRCLDDSFEYYCIQDPEILDGKAHFNSIDDMVDLYSNEIQRHCKGRDVILIGYSYGGNLAVELTRILKLSGTKVPMTILFDSWSNLSELKQAQYGAISNSTRDIKNYFGEGSFRHGLIKKRSSWLASYKPKKIDFPLVLFKSGRVLEPYSLINQETNGWSDYCLSIKKYTIDTDHDNMLKFNYEDLLKNQLKKAL